MPKNNRREQILQAFATMLETHPGSRITTAALAREVGFSEAALYRHFPSKAKIIDALIEFIEDSLFPRVTRILSEATSVQAQCHGVLTLVLLFAERNPGFARLLVGDALQGENDRLRGRMRQIFARLETELRTVTRQWGAVQVPASKYSPATMANTMLAIVEGKISQFVRSEFKVKPSEGWDEQWQLLTQALFEHR